MLAARVRSGLEETFHDGAVAVSDPDGPLVAWSGDIDRPFYLRSSAKPFQSFVSQVSGAGLQPIELAVASASHGGHPVQIALVESILGRMGLTEGDLRCPKDCPLSRTARDQLIRGGETQSRLFEAMHRYPALASGNGEGDTAIATATNSAPKGGALGCIGIGLKSGLGLVVKSWDGRNVMAEVAAVATFDALGRLPGAALETLKDVARPPQMGGGEMRGVAESRMELKFT